jgi:GntR family transcriptional repressor for pyruvate dehydrogenase complex
MTVPFKPIKPKRISDQIFDQLREFILRGQFKPGEKIMTERELSEALNVSRTSVRDAVNRLVALELLEHRQGQGTFVRISGQSRDNPVALAMETPDASLADLLEVRMGLECNAATYAAMRAEEGDIQFLEQSLEETKLHIEIIHQQHTDVFEAIRRHEPEEAFSAMKRHINFILEFLERQSTF